MVCIKTYHKRVDADMAKSVLGASGIEAEVFTDDCGGLRPHMLYGSSGARLMVMKEDVQRAEEILNVYEEKKD